MARKQKDSGKNGISLGGGVSQRSDSKNHLSGIGYAVKGIRYQPWKTTIWLDGHSGLLPPERIGSEDDPARGQAG